MIDGLKNIYANKVKPLEEMYHFAGASWARGRRHAQTGGADFHSPLLRESDFDSKPMVLLLGQYSTGKTTCAPPAPRSPEGTR